MNNVDKPSISDFRSGQVSLRYFEYVNTFGNLSSQNIENQQKASAKHTVLLDFSLSVKAAPHECVIRTGQP